jgi:hypothetical protein
MAAKEPKPKKGKKVTKSLEGVNVSKGLKKAPAVKGEVAGHMSPGAYYLCWHCGASNFVPFGWVYFHCWRCWAFNRC